MQEVRNRMKESTKQDRFNQLEAGISTGKLRTRIARTRRGAGLLRSSQVHEEDLQDRTKPMMVVGADVESLYPSLSAVHVADIVFKAIMESDIKFENINYKEGARYLALNWSRQECRMSKLWRVLPRRASKQGSRPGVTGAGPMGPDEGKVCQWVFPRRAGEEDDSC